MNLKRRDFFKGAAGLAAGAGLSALAANSVRVPDWRRAPQTKEGVETANTARNLVFVFLDGGPSQVDTFDCKKGTWTPSTLAVSDSGSVTWPFGIMPELGARLDQVALVRSLTAFEAVHQRASYQLTTGHRFNPANSGETPLWLATLSYLLDGQRKPTDSLPTAMSIGGYQARNGFLPTEHLGLALGFDGDLPYREHYLPEQPRRFDLLDQLTKPQTAQTLPESLRVQLDFQRQAIGLMENAELAHILDGATDGQGIFGISMKAQAEMAVRALASGKGSRVIMLQHLGWDHHFNIYQRDQLINLSRDLDTGLAHLMDRLAAEPGETTGSMLDETLIVAVGEFGRTGGRLDNNLGRDHYPYAFSALLAGGGIAGGRILGRTNDTADVIIDPGWSHNRFMTILDLLATVYSALGLDWTEHLFNSQGARFEMIPTNLTGPVYAIDGLFA